MEREFKTREEVIKALVEEFDEKPGSFDGRPSRQKFWTFNRLFHYYWDLKLGRKGTYRTKLNQETGYYELNKSRI
jgi:hypothetical protein